MTFVSCDAIRSQLEAFQDDELSLEAHLEVRTHLEHCASCAHESAALARLRDAFRDVPIVTGGPHVRPPDTWAGNLLTQIQIERQLSWPSWLAGIFDDMHLVWPALGATAAVLVCLVGSAQVMEATAVQRPDSLAGVIDYLASPGSNGNPARIDEFTIVPRRHAASDWPVGSEDAVFTLSTVVTREGRIQRVEMLAAEQADALKVKREVIDAMIEAASRAEFEPARAGGAPVAVNLVWLLAHTTVVGSPGDVERLIRPVLPSPSAAFGPHMPVVVRAKPPVTPVTTPVAPSPGPGAPGGGVAFAG